MLIFLGSLAGETGVEEEECNGSDGLEASRGLILALVMIFLNSGSKQATTGFPTGCLQDVLVHLQDPLFYYRNRPKA
jgi:hypothetical protein